MSKLEGWYYTKYKIGDKFKMKNFHKNELKLKNSPIVKLIKIEGCWCSFIDQNNKIYDYKGPWVEIYWERMT